MPFLRSNLQETTTCYEQEGVSSKVWHAQALAVQTLRDRMVSDRIDRKHGLCAVQGPSRAQTGRQRNEGMLSCWQCIHPVTRWQAGPVSCPKLSTYGTAISSSLQLQSSARASPIDGQERRSCAAVLHQTSRQPTTPLSYETSADAHTRSPYITPHDNSLHYPTLHLQPTC
jgi:hypothetical protein